MALVDQLVDQFVKKWENKVINNGGIQCGAIFNQQELEIVQGGWIGTPLTGYVNDLWDNFNNNSYESSLYDRVLSSQPAKKGDIAIWNHYNGGNNLPHVALVLEDIGDHINCFTQNPLPAHIEVLTKVGLDGYLRPKKFVVIPVITLKSNDEIANEVINGDWGNGQDRINRLIAAGYDYNIIQGCVDNKLATTTPILQQTTTTTEIPVQSNIQQFNIGDIVTPTTLIDYRGTPLVQYDPSYRIIELIDDRAILEARGQIWCAMNIANLKHA